MISFYIGLDLGQKRDPAAIAIVEKKGLILVRHLERMPLGTTYPNIVERIRRIANHHPLAGRCALAVDGTGLGAPVVDMLRAARIGCEIAAVTITGGEKESKSGNTWNVPRTDLIAGLQLLLEQKQIKIASRLKETEAIVRELMNINSPSHHDDLVFALSLACWRAKRGEIGHRSVPFF